MSTTRMRTGTKLAIAALVLAVGCVITWFQLARAVALPENRTVFVAIWLLAAALGIAAFVKGTGWAGRFAAIVAIVIGSFLPFTVSISEQVASANAIQVGDTIPAFAAPDEDGEIFDSERLRGKPVLIKFFRAHW